MVEIIFSAAVAGDVSDVGAGIGQADISFLRTEYWREGSIIQTTTGIAVNGSLSEIQNITIHVGMYSFSPDGQLQNVSVRGADGNLLGTEVVFEYENAP